MNVHRTLFYIVFAAVALAARSGLALEAKRPLPICPMPKGDGKTPPGQEGSARARLSAQRGLDFLARETVKWQKANNCFGCHVQGVTLEALSVGVHNQYRVAGADLRTIVDGMLNSNGGARRKGGFSHLEVHYFGTAKSFGGNAFARYDQWVGSDVRHDLLKVAGELLTFQKQDGSIDSDYPTMLPVAVGAVQRTYQAAQTWRQAHARSADDRWLQPIARAERFLQDIARNWAPDAGGAGAQRPSGKALPGNIQEVNYALLGLQAAGVSPAEPVMRTLSRHVLKLQKHDGGWGYTAADASNALATGESLYTLRMLGLTDRDPSVARGSEWLIAHQNQDGGWSNAGFGKAEAMWAVLGLVTTDVLTVALSGLEDGQHVAGAQALRAEARDNATGGGGVVQVELAIDDVAVTRACGPALTHTWDTAALEPGKHIVDVTATNAKGQVSRRRLEVYAGNVFLTQVGARTADDGTHVSLRNIAAADPKAKVELQILALDKKGAAQADAPVATVAQGSAVGPMDFFWNGQARGGKAAPNGKYVARMVYRDAAGKIVQSEDTVIVRDTVANQASAYGQVAGRIAMPMARPVAGAASGMASPPAPSANTRIELVDGAGNVVQSVRSTSEGQYRFKNVDAGKYKVRVRKDGFQPVEQDVAAQKGAEAAADVSIK